MKIDIRCTSEEPRLRLNLRQSGNDVVLEAVDGLGCGKNLLTVTEDGIHLFSSASIGGLPTDGSGHIIITNLDDVYEDQG